jgi:hypothetical protein
VTLKKFGLASARHKMEKQGEGRGGKGTAGKGGSQLIFQTD